MASRLSTPEEIAASAGAAIPFLRLPVRETAFAARAARLRGLAPGHAMQDYLEFVARIADRQQALLAALPGFPLPDAAELARARSEGRAPLDCSRHVRDPAWRDLLRRLADQLAATVDQPLAGRLETLARRDDPFLDAQAARLIGGVTLGLDVAAAPLIAAALQVYFCDLVIRLGEAAFPPSLDPSFCPCCGGRPTASVTVAGGREGGYRFLHCSLCGAEWHMVRIKCPSCQGTEGIRYESLDDGTPAARHAVQAEVCPSCGSYLKIVHAERDPRVDPVADDLASLALDLLVVEAGSQPCGVNFMLIHGDAGPA